METRGISFGDTSWNLMVGRKPVEDDMSSRDGDFEYEPTCLNISVGVFFN